MPKNLHVCALSVRRSDSSYLPKLPPNASKLQKIRRELRKLVLMNFNHYKCKKLFRNRSSMIEEKKKHIATCPWVIHPLSTLNSIIEFVFVCLWFYVIMQRSLMMFSDHINPILDLVLDHIICPIQLIVIVLLFNCGYVEKKTQLVVIDPVKIVFRYLTTYFIFDLGSSFVVVEMLNHLSEQGYVRCTTEDTLNSTYCSDTFEIISIVSGFVRIGTLLSYIDDLLSQLRVSQLLIACFIHVARTFMYLHSVAFVFYTVPYLKYRGKWPKLSWLTQAELDHHAPLRYQYFESLIMAVCTFFGIGYNVELHLIEEQIMSALVMVMGRLYTLYLIADILNLFGVVGVSETMYDKQISMLEQYMVVTGVSDALKHRMFKYYEFKYQGRFFKEQPIVNNLSELLRAELFLFAARKIIDKVEFFKRLPQSAVGTIVAAMTTEVFSPKDIILEEGRMVEDMFFISAGTVSVIDRSGRELCHLEDGDCFGAVCVFTKTQLYSIVAVETTEIFAVSRERLIQFLSAFPEVSDAFFTSMRFLMTKLSNLEQELKMPKYDLLDDLQSGHILEERTKRIREN